MNRRRVFEWLFRSGTAVGVAVVALPSLLAGLSPALRRAPAITWRRVGRLDDFPVGQTLKAVVVQPEDQWPQPVEPLAVYVWRVDDAKVVVFSRACTDLGCPVTYDSGSHAFYCPCHGGIFERNGTPIAGPPPRPLHRFAHRLRDGMLEIDLASIPPVT